MYEGVLNLEEKVTWLQQIKSEGGKWNDHSFFIFLQQINWLQPYFLFPPSMSLFKLKGQAAIALNSEVIPRCSWDLTTTVLERYHKEVS